MNRVLSRGSQTNEVLDSAKRIICDKETQIGNFTAGLRSIVGKKITNPTNMLLHLCNKDINALTIYHLK